MKKIRELFLRYVLLGYVVFSFAVFPLTSHATITPLISYQAKLTDTNNVAVADASYTVKFRIFSVSSGGSALYAEQQSVTTANGLFNALIGSGTLIESSGALSAVDFNQDPLYLGVQIGSDDEMTPRKRIASSVFAFNANKVGGKSETEFALLAGRSGGQTLPGGTASGENLTLQSTANATKGKIFFGANSAYNEASSTFGIGTSTPQAALDVKGTADISQFIVRANSAQSNSNPIIRVLTNTGSELFRLHSDDSTNLFLGASAGAVNTASGTRDIFIGGNVGSSNISGVRNTAIGYGSFAFHSTGDNNTAIGDSALAGDVSGGGNTAIGSNTMGAYPSTAFNNTAVGTNALSSLTSGSGNVAMGWGGLSSLVGGTDNTSLGYQAGNSTTGSGNVFLGFNAGYNETGSNKLYIANNSSTPLIYGDFSTGNVTFGAASTPTAFSIIRSGGSGNTVSSVITYGTNTSVLSASKARGTSASPTAVQSGDTLGVFGFNGYGATEFTSANTGRVGGVAEENWTDSSRGTSLVFSVTPAGSSTISTAMKIDDNGSVGIGTLSPISPLSVVRNDGVNSAFVSAVTYASSFIGSDLQSAFIAAGARGTESTPSAVQSGDELGEILFTGYGSTGFGTEGGAAVQGNATGAWTDTSQPAELRFVTTPTGTSTDAVRMVISEDGSVGIGTNTPTNALDIVRDGQEAVVTVSGFGNGSNDYGSLYLTRTRGSVAAPSAVQFGNTLGRLHFAGYDGVGFNQIGATIEAGSFENWDGTSHGTSLTFGTTANATTTVAARMVISDTGDVGIGTVSPGSRLEVYLATSTSAVNIFQVFSDVSSTQNTVFRVDTDGNVFADGTFTPGGADLAENYIASDASLESGDIVSFSSQSLGVNKSEIPYDVKLLGIVSKKPGVLLGGDMEKSVPLALSGRVPTKVSLKNGAIFIGDPITSSDIAGVGMKATKSGRIIGYALEDYNGAPSNEIKTILVFANLGYHLGDEVFGGGGTSYDGFSAMLTNTLSSFTGTIKATGTWMFDRIQTTFLGTKYIQIESGVTMKDKITGDYYCLSLQNGEITKAKGTCEELDAPVGGGGSTSSVPSESSPEPPASSSDASSTSPQMEEATTTLFVETPSSEITTDTASSIAL